MINPVLCVRILYAKVWLIYAKVRLIYAKLVDVYAKLWHRELIAAKQKKYRGEQEIRRGILHVDSNVFILNAARGAGRSPTSRG